MNELDLIEFMQHSPAASYLLTVHPSQLKAADQMTDAFPEIRVIGSPYVSPGQWLLVAVPPQPRQFIPRPPKP